jgi:hypothetical protein
MKAIGHKLWAIPGGHIPIASTGHEPECTSHDALCLLNTGDDEAAVAVTLYYTDRDPVGPYPVKVPPRRVRHVRVNDLIDPAAPPLGVDYATVIESNVPIVVQFIRRDTSQPANAVATAMAFPVS